MTTRITVYKQYKKAYLIIGNYTYGIRPGVDGNLIDLLVDYKNHYGKKIPINLPTRYIAAIMARKQKPAYKGESMFVQGILNPADKALIYYGLIFKDES
jgi:hypothetical protein